MKKIINNIIEKYKHWRIRRRLNNCDPSIFPDILFDDNFEHDPEIAKQIQKLSEMEDGISIDEE